MHVSRETAAAHTCSDQPKPHRSPRIPKSSARGTKAAQLIAPIKAHGCLAFGPAPTSLRRGAARAPDPVQQRQQQRQVGRRVIVDFANVLDSGPGARRVHEKGVLLECGHPAAQLPVLRVLGGRGDEPGRLRRVHEDQVVVLRLLRSQGHHGRAVCVRRQQETAERLKPDRLVLHPRAPRGATALLPRGGGRGGHAEQQQDPRLLELGWGRRAGGPLGGGRGLAARVQVCAAAVWNARAAVLLDGAARRYVPVLHHRVPLSDLVAEAPAIPPARARRLQLLNIGVEADGRVDAVHAATRSPRRAPNAPDEQRDQCAAGQAEGHWSG
eukprot:scaffold27705_cov129-Isochrysis_galbana.AAC.1